RGFHCAWSCARLSEQLFDVTNRVVVITGAATGIGKALARGLAGAGMHAVLADVDETGLNAAAQEIRAGRGSATAVVCDVSRRPRVEALMQKVLGEFGRLDALINNAALPRTDEEDEFLEMSEQMWDRTMAVNLKGAFLCAQSAARIMRAAKRGSIINITSQLASVAIPNRTAYIASKGGLQSLTKALAVDLAPMGIRVNAIAPGPVATNRTAGAWEDPQLYESVVARMLLGRVGQPPDYVGTAIYLCSDASAFVTGATIVVDGGYLAT
ncbi:MAG: SDR family NAD(P)-dependent oxidoreductase, partial [Polyangiaceae bacterium]